MSFLTGYWWLDISIVLYVALTVVFDIYRRYNRNYWKNKSVPFIPQANLYELLKLIVRSRKSHITQFDKDQYTKLSGHKFGGSFELRRPYLILRDPDIIKLVMVKDFDHFVNRRTFDNIFGEVFGKMLTLLKDQEWKDMRSLISPTFTSGKIKRMFDNVIQCSDLLQEFIDDKIKEKNGELVIDECFQRFSAEVIASVAFALQVSSFDKSSDFFNHLKLMQKIKVLVILKLLVGLAFPSLVKKFKLKLYYEKPVDYFLNQIQAVIKHRRETGEVRNDFLQLLLEARKGDMLEDECDDDQYDRDARLDKTKKKKGALSVTENHVFAQAFLFIAAGFDTVSSLLSLVAYELALHPEIQDRLVSEIQNTFDDGELTYQGIQEMEYLDMVVSETLRKYPIASRLERECVDDYRIPDTDITIEKKTLVVIPAFAIHRDERFYPDPDTFNPERFSAEEKKKRSPYVYLPFGQGPRNCIGMRFALLEAKVAIVKLLQKFELSPCEKTQIPLTFSRTAQLLKGKDGISLKVQQRNNSYLCKKCQN